MNYIVLDLETTGLDTQKDRVIEIGIWTDNQATSKLVRPTEPIPENIQRITGITQKMVDKDGEDINTVLDWVLDSLDPGMIVIGHNILKFDHPFILTECRRVNHPLQEVLTLDRLIDTAGLFKGRQLKMWRKGGESHVDYAMRVLDTRVTGLKFNLKEACTTMGVNTEGLIAHRAAGDVEMTQRLYERLMDPTNPI